MEAFLTFYLQDGIYEHSNRIQNIVIVIHGNLIHISGNVTQFLITYLVSMDQKLIHHHRRFITMEETTIRSMHKYRDNQGGSSKTTQPTPR